jgi:HTH-type transcriptional regulator/antitoxin HigA
MDIKPIRTRKDHEAALKRIEALMDLEPRKDTLDGDELDVLATLVEAYEDKHFPIDPPDPIEAILSQMEQLGMDRSDLVPMIGGRGRVSEVLNKKRPLSINMIRSISVGMNIPVDVLVREYELTR